MPAANKTDNIELNQWLGNEYPKREDTMLKLKDTDTAIKEQVMTLLRIWLIKRH